MSGPPEIARTLYRGARIFTATEQPWAEAMVVRGDRIEYVGDDRSAREAAGPAAQVVDLEGVIVPGFIDAHAHLLMSGAAEVRARLTTAPDLVEIQRRVRDWATAHPEAPRVLGQGWLFSAVPGGTPTRQMLDEVVPDRPVYLDANDYHSVWVNTLALDELAITDSTPDPVGGRITRDPAGRATGHLDETVIHNLVWPFLEDANTDANRDAQLSAALRAYPAAGVTGAIDMGMEPHALAAMDRAERAGRLDTRIVGHWLIHRAGSGPDHLEQIQEAARLAKRHRTSLLRMGGVKFVVDGVIDGCTAAMGAPYADGSNAEPIWDFPELSAAVTAADALGLQVALHAIGDRAVRVALDALEHARTVNGPRPSRHRIEHLEYVDPVDVPRLAELGVTASMQPVHADPAVQDNWRSMLGDTRAERGYAWPEFTAAGAHLALGTDTPTAPYHPLPNMFIAATRRSAIDPALPANHAHLALPLADAVRHATADVAWSCHDEADRGALAPGMLADFAVLDPDPFFGEPERLLTTRITRTVLGGRSVHGH